MSAVMCLLFTTAANVAYCQANPITLKLSQSQTPSPSGVVNLDLEIENISAETIRVFLPVKYSVKFCPSVGGNSCKQPLANVEKLPPPNGHLTGSAAIIPFSPKEKRTFHVTFPGQFEMSKPGEYAIAAIETLPGGNEISSNILNVGRETSGEMNVVKESK